MCKLLCVHLSAALSRASRSRQVLAIWFFIVLSLTFIPAMSFAQSKPNSSPTNTTPTISQLRDLSTQLVQRLTARIAESETLSAELAALQEQAVKLQADLSETSTSLDSSKTALQALQSDFDGYKTQADLDKKALKNERDTALVKAKINGIGFKITIGIVAIAGGYELGRYFKLW